MVITPAMLEGETKDIGLVGNIFSACGPYVRKILVADVRGGKAKYSLELFMSHVFHYCRNVEQVSFQEYRASFRKCGIASSFFREYAPTLRTIDWDGEEDETGFPDWRQCVSVRRLQSRKLSTATLLAVLEACGSTLEEIHVIVRPVTDSHEVLRTIRNHCRKLRVLNIWNSEDVIGVVGQESYSSLICGYGAQLKNATTCGLDPEHLVEVVRACTNLEVDVRWRNAGCEDWRHTYYLGPRVVSLHINADLLYGDEYVGALGECSNLRDLFIYGCSGGARVGVTDEKIANLFSQSRYPKLERLTIGDFRPNERNVSSIASCTTNLKSANFYLFELDSDLSGFEFIAGSNKQLQDIRLVMDVFREGEPSEEAALEWLSKVVKIFRKCRKLELKVSCSNEGGVKEEDLIRTCKVLPCRDVDVYVVIGDVNYQYPD